MWQFLLGALFTGAVFAFVKHLPDFARRPVTPLIWIAGFAILLYGLLVAEMVLAFLLEGALRGAMVTGLVTGFPAVAAGLLYTRFILRKSALSGKEAGS